MVEFIVIAPLLLFFCLGIVQFVLLYQARATLDYAALQAAREGAVDHGAMASMHRGLARGLAPLYARQASLAGAQQALNLAIADAAARSEIVVISPTSAMLDDFGRHGREGTRQVTEIPNDSLSWRSTLPGKTSGVNIQDANLLKIRVRYCYDMYVPLAGKAIYYIANVIGNIGRSGILTRETPGDSDVYGEPRAPSPCLVPVKDGIASGRWPLALEAEALVRMQSGYRGGS